MDWLKCWFKYYYKLGCFIYGIIVKIIFVIKIEIIFNFNYKYDFGCYFINEVI